MRAPETRGASDTDLVPMNRTTTDAPSSKVGASPSTGKRNVGEVRHLTDAKTLAERSSSDDVLDMSIRGSKIENFPFPITEAERANYMSRFVEASGKIEELTEEKNRVRVRVDRAIRELKAELNALRVVLYYGVEHRRVCVLEEKNLQNRTLTVYRADTGDLLYVRPLTVEEMQADLPFTHQERAADVVQFRSAGNGPEEGSS